RAYNEELFETTDIRLEIHRDPPAVRGDTRDYRPRGRVLGPYRESLRTVAAPTNGRRPPRPWRGRRAPIRVLLRHASFRGAGPSGEMPRVRDGSHATEEGRGRGPAPGDGGPGPGVSGAGHAGGGAGGARALPAPGAPRGFLRRRGGGRDPRVEC